MNDQQLPLMLRVSAADGVPIYLQIVNQIKFLAASGRLVPGYELPAIRTLAEDLTINPNTVARAYRELEVSGIVEKRRTNGTYIADGGSRFNADERLRILTDRVDGLLAEAIQLEVSIADLLELVERRHRQLFEERPKNAEAAS